MKNINIHINLRLFVVLPLLLPVIMAGRSLAASTGTIAATITPQNISVSVSDGAVSYGVLNLNTTADTTSSDVNDTQLATNDGNVAEDFNIRSSDATGGNTWTLAGTTGADQFKHSFCVNGVGGSPDPCDLMPSWSAMSTSYSPLATNVAPAGDQKFDLQIQTPTSVTDYAQKTVTITVQAVIN